MDIRYYIDKFFEPKSLTEDSRRKEFILNTLLFTSIVFLILALASYLISLILIFDDLVRRQSDCLSSIFILAILIFFIFLYFLSRKGFVNIASYLLVGAFFMLATYMSYQWGVEVQAALLFYVLIIVMSGILINTRFAFITTTISSLALAIINFFQNNNILHPNRYWLTENAGMPDVFMFSVIFFIIATVSWLSNREIEKSLARARKSEVELKEERDSLEIKVEERTLELKAEQIKQISQLYKFAEFGKLSSGFFHDIINPLTVVSLNMAQIKNEHTREIEGVKFYFDKASVAIKRMENFIVAVRKQMANQKTEVLFSLQKEISSVIQILDYKIKKANVKIVFVSSKDIIIYGDPTKFSQIILNLITNAIDSYINIYDARERKVKIEVFLKDGFIYLSVQDWGCGVVAESREKVFQPFFTTKENDAGTGIGLYLVKNIIENSFDGAINFKSEKDNGSIFNVNFPVRNKFMDNPVNYLLSRQQKDGSFLIDENTNVLISTAFVLICLNNLAETPEIKEMKEKAINFLLSKKDDNWRFSENIGINFLALSAIAEYNPELIDGGAMAKILMFLTLAEVKEGGPYYSYINKQDKETDLVTNVIVAYFLALQDVDLPELNKLIDSAIEIGNFDSRIFESIYSLVYLISNFYKGDKKEKLINFILEKSNERNNQLYIWIADLALDNLRNKKLNVAGRVVEDEQEIKIMELIFKAAEEQFSTLEGDAKKLAMREIQKTIKGNKDGQMSLMAYYFRKALGKNGEKFSDELIAKMGVANIFFWTAFIIYDDFWDEDEAANPQILPIANLYARRYVDFFDFVLPESTGFRAFFHKLMDDLDAANTWENMHCRAKVEGLKFFIPEKLPEYGDYEFKFRPASGHILGPVAMLINLGYSLDSAEVKNIISYFKNYLIAMQINDDAHDWEEDLRRGHISTVVDMLLRDLNWQKREIDLDTNLNELRKVFWFKTMPKAEELALFYAEKAKQALLAVGLFENLSPLEKFININKNVAEKALKEQKESVKFLQNFN